MTGPEISFGSDWLRNLMPHFLEQTRDRLTEIRSYQEAIRDGSNAMVGMKSICDISHKISGTADTFGFCYLGALAQNVEAIWSNSSHCGDNTMVTWFRMESAITPLVQELENLLKLN